MRIASHLWFAFLATMMCCTALHAGEAVPLLQPQWIASVATDQLEFDNIATSPDPAALRLLDGSEITVTVTSTDIVLRRYAADGSVQRATSATVGSSLIHVVIRATPSNDAFYVLAGSEERPALLMRFDSELERVWTVTLPDEGGCSYGGAALHLELMTDDSVIAMRAFRILRVGVDGVVQWNFFDPDATCGFLGAALAVGSTAIWVATSNPHSYLDSTTTLTRLDFDGARLSADVSSCHGCGGYQLADIDLTGDGGARVVGNTDGRGFFARYDALGFRLFWAASDTQQTYFRLDHDAADACYVLALDQSAGKFEKSVHRMDAATGATLWSVTADDFVARDAGVVTLLNTDAGIRASAIDASGAALWTQTLTQNQDNWLPLWSEPAFVGGDVELLIKNSTASADPCALYPRFARMDGIGTLTWFPFPCRPVERPETVWAIDAIAGKGVLINTFSHLAAYSPNGDLRWRLEACLWCSDDSGASTWYAAALASDGGAWAVHWYRPTLASPDDQTRIERFDASGALVFDVASFISAAGGGQRDLLRLLSGNGDVVMLRAFQKGLSWQRIGSGGVDLGSRIYSIPDVNYTIDEALRLPDDGTLVLTKGWGSCNVGCPPFYTSVLRLAADGTLVWRYQLPEIYAYAISVALRADGSALAVLPPTSSDGLLSMRLIGSDGSVESDIPLVAVDAFVRADRLTSALAGRWLLSTGSQAGEEAYWLLDDDGHVALERHDGPFSEFLQTSVLGYLASELISYESQDTVLLDPNSLVDRARFYNGSGIVYGPRPWRILDDGSVYGTITLPQSGYQAVARYSVPGGVPSDVIFRNGMD